MIYKPNHRKHWFAHIDCDCFFVSVERITRPELRDRAVCVCGPTGNSGVVTCASYEARPYGIRAGTPVFKAKQMCPHALYIKGDFRKYGNASYALFNILKKYSPVVEHMSVDEGYLDLTGITNIHKCTFKELGLKMQNEVIQKLQLPITIGIAPTKTLAKMASNYQKPFGCTVLDPEYDFPRIYPTPLKNVCGFGRKIQIKLHSYNINTIGEFCQLNGSVVNHLLGLPGLVIWHELQGISFYPIKNAKKPPKSILRSAMFPQKTDNYTFIKDWLHARLEEACKKLNMFNLKTAGLGIFIRIQHPAKHKYYYKLEEPTQSFITLSNTINKTLPQIYQAGSKYRAAGVWFNELKPNNRSQPELPFIQAEQQNPNLITTINQCEKKFGRNSLMTASRLMNKHKKDQFNLAFIG